MPIDSRERSRPLASIAVIARYDPSRALPDAGRILIRWPVALQEAGLSERHLQRLRSSAPIDLVNVTSGLPPSRGRVGVECAFQNGERLKAIRSSN